MEKVERVSEANRKRWTILVPIVTFVLLLFVLLISALRKTCGPVENKRKNIYIYIDEWSLIFETVGNAAQSTFPRSYCHITL